MSKRTIIHPHQQLPIINSREFNFDSVSWPEYIDSISRPFMYNNALYSKTGAIDNKWCGTDSKSLYEKNLKKTPSDWWYRTKEIIYSTNKSGYRTYEFENIDWKNSIVIFGCSYVYGVGLADDELMSHYLSKFIGRPVINLGYPGGSNDLILQLNLLLSKYYETPWAIAVMWTHTDRYRLFTSTLPDNIGSWNEKSSISDGVDLNELWAVLNTNKTHEQMRNYFTAMAVKQLWKDKCKFVSGSFVNTSNAYCNGGFTSSSIMKLEI